MLTVDGKHYENSFEMLLAALNHIKQKTTTEKDPEPNKVTKQRSLVITNLTSNNQTQSSRKFQALLEPRDQLLNHTFNIEIDLEGSFTGDESLGFTGTTHYEYLLKKIKVFLVEAVSNVVSISFNYLNEGKLAEKEAMEYAAKNIMLNIQNIFRQTVSAIEQHPKLIKKINSQQLRADLINHIEEILDNVLINLADLYPQAPASGGTPRMREVINEVNHVDNEENDLILANDLLISKHLKLTTGVSRDNQLTQKVDFQKEDYTEFIMEVINAAIQASQNNEQDSRERTVKQIFTEFNEKLFCLSQHKKYKHVVNDLEEKRMEETKEGEDKAATKDSIKRKVLRYFDLTLQRNRNALEKYKESKEEQQLIDESEAGLEQLRRQKKFLIGQKIPSFVNVFSRQDINNKNFTARHSSILRILTKWAQYLEDIFKNSQSYVKKRLYPFKNIKNQLVFIKEAEEKDRLIRQLNEEYKQVKAKFYEIFNSNSSFITTLLMAEQEQFVSNVCRYTDTRIVCSKINAVLTALMVKYTSILIHHLLRAGREILTNKREQNINLIVFRVSDLLRAKFQCSESTFINLLKTMYLLDSSQAMRKKFKLVRIKNKLDDPANNIIINYLFMGKVQCELQMSIQEPKGKEKNYYIFSHFVYELTRGKFGTIAQCAIMTSQLDPMISACKHSYYIQKERKKQVEAPPSLDQKCRTVKSEEDIEEQQQRRQLDIQQLAQPQIPEEKCEKRQDIFECVLCHRLVINQTQGIFTTIGNQSLCNKCIIETKDPQSQLQNYELQSAISEGIEANLLKRINNFVEIRRQDNVCIVSLSGNGKLNLNVVIEIRKQFKVFLVRLDDKLLKEIDSKKFEYSSIDYFNITNCLKNHQQLENLAFELLYTVPGGPGSLSDKLCQLINVKKDLVASKLGAVIEGFKRFQEEKTIIKTIKFKAEIININQDSSRFKTFGKIVQGLVLGEGSRQGFKYTRYKHLDLSNLKEIQVIGVNVQTIPTWLRRCLNFHKVDFEANSIRSIAQDELPTSTSELFLRQNKIQKIDLSRLINLSKLDLDCNRLEDIDLKSLHSLTKVSLSNNKLKQVDLSCLDHLAYAYLNNNQIAEINLQHLTALKELSLNSNNLETIEVSGLVNLSRLSLNNNSIAKIDLSHLNNLSILNLHKNELQFVDLSNLTQLTHVVLNKNKLTAINLSNLTSLVNLCLDENQLTDLDLSDLISLTRLDIGSNLFTTIDLSSLTNLSMLGLDNNRLQMIDLSNLSSLTSLDLDNNELQSIDLSNSSCLSELYLSHNRLHELDLSNLFNLYILSVNDNSLQLIDLSSLNLKQLHIDRKDIIGYDFIEMSMLEKLYIYNGFISEQQLLNLNINVLVEIVGPDDLQ